MANEQTNEDDRIAPVALPAGSFEVTDLKKALDTAVGVKNRETHPERIQKAISDTIVQPEVLANLDAPAIPTGASLVDQEVVYVEGTEPVKTKGVAFDPVEAEDGTAASKMHYESRPRKEEVVATDEPRGVVVPDDADPAVTLSEQAEQRVEEEATDGAKRSGKSSK